MRAQRKSQYYGCELTNWWIVSQHPARLLSTSSQYSFNLVRSWPPSASPNSLDHGLQVHLWVQLHLGLEVHLETRTIMASKCISEFTRSWPPSSYNNGLQVHVQTRPITASKFATSCPPSASQNSLDYGLQMHLWVHSIRSSQCISKLARSWPPSAFLYSPNNRRQVYLWVHSIVIFRRTSICSSTACSQSRYTLCRWVAI